MRGGEGGEGRGLMLTLRLWLWPHHWLDICQVKGLKGSAKFLTMAANGPTQYLTPPPPHHLTSSTE